MKLLEKIGVYGWSKTDENLMLASLLTGDPLVMIGTHGSAKTHVAYKIAQTLDKQFLAYDASKALFEDVLGFPNVESLKQGRVTYIPSEVTIWDKQFVLIDEINRALPELQAKWLEIIRSRKIMGHDTDVKWVWAAMNPLDAEYVGTQTLDAALVGRFATFLYPPEAKNMEESDRIKVVQYINDNDAPGLLEWTDTKNAVEDKEEDTNKQTGKQVHKLLMLAAKYFKTLKAEYAELSAFLSRLSVLLIKETDNQITLDGRRLGFIYRNILAVRAIEVVRSKQFGTPLNSFVDTVKSTIAASIPTGLTDNGVNKEEATHKILLCIDLLSDYLESKTNFQKVDTVYRLFTSSDLIEITRILVNEDLKSFVSLKAWNDLLDTEDDISYIAYAALQIEEACPGTVPAELLAKTATRIAGNDARIKLNNEAVEYYEEIQNLLNQDTNLRILISNILVNQAVTDNNTLTKEDVQNLVTRVKTTIEEIESLIIQKKETENATSNSN